MSERRRGPWYPHQALRAVSVLLLVGIVAGALGVPRSTRATVTLSVAPSLVELEAEEGATGSQTLTVGNGGDEPIDVSSVVEAYKGATGERSAVDWLRVEPADFRLEPGQQQAVTVAIALPEGELDSGGRYAAVAFTTGATPVEGGGMAMAGKLAVPFLIQVNGRGKLTRAVAVPKFAPILAPDGRVGFAALLRNEGNLHVTPEGTVTVTGGDGSPYASLDVPRPTTVLPGSEVILAAHGTVPLESGATYRAALAMDFGADDPVEATAEFSPEVALEVAGTSVCENLDRGPTVQVDLRNDGELGVAPRVHASVRDEIGNLLASAPSGAPVVAWPGEDTGIVLDLSERLISGAYVLSLRVEITPPDREGRVAVPPIEREVTFRIGGLGGDAVPLCPPAPA